MFMRVSVLALTAAALPAAAEPSYADQQNLVIRALSEQEVADLLAGKGLGFAKAAELNHYPGPRHALDLAADLALSAGQVVALQAVFNQMQAEARFVGAALVEREAGLDRLFADRRIDDASLDTETAAIADLRGELRRVHLAAHLETREILTPQQVARYDVARGYGGHAGGGAHGQGNKKHH